jgi:hypothetical protein
MAKMEVEKVIQDKKIVKLVDDKVIQDEKIVKLVDEKVIQDKKIVKLADEKVIQDKKIVKLEKDSSFVLSAFSVPHIKTLAGEILLFVLGQQPKLSRAPNYFNQAYLNANNSKSTLHTSHQHFIDYCTTNHIDLTVTLA